MISEPPEAPVAPLLGTGWLDPSHALAQWTRIGARGNSPPPQELLLDYASLIPFVRLSRQVLQASQPAEHHLQPAYSFASTIVALRPYDVLGMREAAREAALGLRLQAASHPLVMELLPSRRYPGISPVSSWPQWRMLHPLRPGRTSGCAPLQGFRPLTLNPSTPKPQIAIILCGKLLVHGMPLLILRPESSPSASCGASVLNSDRSSNRQN